jgi:hypothetical protein
MTTTPLVRVDVIRHADQRYDTCGDWLIDHDGRIIVRVSELGDWRFEFLIAIHEMVEAALCHHRGISEEAVTAFDKEHEAGGGDGEPGEHPDAPYRKEHAFATLIEAMVARELGVDWPEYGDAIDGLTWGEKT